MASFFTMALMLFLLMPGTPAPAAVYHIDGDVIGSVETYRIKKGDTLYTVARKFDLGIVEVMAANPGVDPWMPEEGSAIVLPSAFVLPAAQPGAIVINLSELRLYLFMDKAKVMTFPIGIGKEGWETPLGSTRIVRKREAPVWFPPDSIRAETPDLPAFVPAGPENPLGTYALNLAWKNFVIHGTNRPYGIGRRSSHGCIRLYPEDIPLLYANVDVGVKVTVIDKPYQLGWQDGRLWLKVTPDQRQADEIMTHGTRKTAGDLAGIREAVVAAAGPAAEIDWAAVDAAVKNRSGLPVRVAER